MQEHYDLDLMFNAVKSVFVAPRIRQKEVTTLILGAWGCGAFDCKPEDVGQLFVKAIQKGLGRLYLEVHFALPCFGDADVAGGKNRSVILNALTAAGIPLVEV
eukprot:gnl/TRDRNA2_/TRDRNA2_139844_c0_seq2.p1 gnl/TRDRNA2_/TRDRNA2_139844_c0~~gnl/TRDRNA2_/TRDRNA2_139844_c0_seq2.p1  ORF type:complete len:103 (+),score=17.85 gnl/TRDRNA2_/TRDRNA2_139844_c0_seq2:175-483(+)